MKEELTLEGRINKTVTPSLSQLGYEVIKVSMVGEGSRNILRILIERKDEIKIGVEDCKTVSKQISVVLDIEEPELGNYTLEVSSPGIDRPLTRLKDFSTYAELEVRLETFDSVENQRKFRGRLKGIEGNEILIDANITSLENPEDKNITKIDFDNIRNAKLILNDELLALSKSDNI